MGTNFTSLEELNSFLRLWFISSKEVKLLSILILALHPNSFECIDYFERSKWQYRFNLWTAVILSMYVQLNNPFKLISNFEQIDWHCEASKQLYLISYKAAEREFVCFYQLINSCHITENNVWGGKMSINFIVALYCIIFKRIIV
jgi:hypothetical protein